MNANCAQRILQGMYAMICMRVYVYVYAFVCTSLGVNILKLFVRCICYSECELCPKNTSRYVCDMHAYIRICIGVCVCESLF